MGLEKDGKSESYSLSNIPIDWKAIREINDEKKFRETINPLIHARILSSEQSKNYEIFSKDGRSLNLSGLYFKTEKHAEDYRNSLGIPADLIHHPPRFTKGNLEQRTEKGVKLEKVILKKELPQKSEEKRVKKYRIKEIAKGIIASPLMFVVGSCLYTDIYYEIANHCRTIGILPWEDESYFYSRMLPLLTGALYFGKKIYNSVRAKHRVNKGKDKSSLIKKALAIASVLVGLSYEVHQPSGQYTLNKAKEIIQNQKEYVISQITPQKTKQLEEKVVAVEKETKKLEDRVSPIKEIKKEYPVPTKIIFDEQVFIGGHEEYAMREYDRYNLSEDFIIKDEIGNEKDVITLKVETDVSSCRYWYISDNSNYGGDVIDLLKCYAISKNYPKERVYLYASAKEGYREGATLYDGKYVCVDASVYSSDKVYKYKWGGPMLKKVFLNVLIEQRELKK